MTQADKKKRRLLTGAALLLLFFSRWMAYRFADTSAINARFFAAVCALLLSAYLLTLFRAPLPVQALCLFAGAAGLVCAGMLFDRLRTAGPLLPAAYCAAPLFYAAVSAQSGDRRFSALAKGLEGALLVYPPFLAGLLVYTAVGSPAGFSAASVGGTALSVPVCAVYIMMARTPADKKTKSVSGDSRRTRRAFLCAAAAVPLTALYPALLPDFGAQLTVLLLWTVNTALLYEEGQPQVTAFFRRIFQKRKTA